MPACQPGPQFAAQHLRIRTRDQNLAPAVQRAGHIPLPPRHVLNLVENHRLGLAFANHLVQKQEVRGCERRQPQVVKMDGHHAAAEILRPLVQQGRLPSAPNPRHDGGEAVHDG